MVRDDDGEWVLNEKYLDVSGDRDPYEYSEQGERPPQ
jgi:hypothetical protein